MTNVFRPALSGVALSKTNAKKPATLEISADASVKLHRYETTETITKGKTMKTKTKKISMISIRVKALALVASAGLALGIGAGLT
jgi:hypothetical protein